LSRALLRGAAVFKCCLTPCFQRRNLKGWEGDSLFKEQDNKLNVVIPPPGRLKQEDCKFKASPGYIARPCLKTKGEVPVDIAQ
jgi:hypothetical protein